MNTIENKLQAHSNISSVTTNIAVSKDGTKTLTLFITSARPAHPISKQEINAILKTEAKQLNIKRLLLFIDQLALTHLQNAMVAQTLSLPSSGNAVGQVQGEIAQTINSEILKEAWEYVVKCNTPLNTYFSLHNDGGLYQNFETEFMPILNIEDWQHHNDTEQQKKLSQRVHDERSKGFATSSQALVRFTAIQLSAQQWHLLWTYHNAILDEHSIALLIKDFFFHYDSILKGKKLPPPIADNNFQHFICWIESIDLDVGKAFWSRQVSEVDSPLELLCPQDVSKSSVTKQISHQSQRLSEQLTAQLRMFATQCQIDMRTLVHAAWLILLHHYSDSSNLIFGSARSCRNNTIENAKTTIGMLVNTVPFIVKLQDDEKLIEFLKRIQSIDQSIEEFEHIPLGEIQNLSHLEPGTPLFENLLAFNEYSVNDMLEQHFKEIFFRDFHYQGQNGLPISMVVYDGKQLTFNLEFNNERFSTETMKRFFQNLIHIISILPDFKQETIQQIPCIDERQQRKLQDWNKTKKKFDSEKCLHHFFESAVDTFPDSIALTYNDQHLTYQELETKANQLANYLLSFNITPDEPVALLMDRSLEMVISLYGILKAGGAYLPLDPEHPVERLQTILEEACPRILLTQSWHSNRLSTLSPDIEIFSVDSNESILSDYLPHRPESKVTPKNLAYIMYTSGSTGRPKGVMNEHKGICNYLQWMQEAYCLLQDDSVLQKTPYTFDVSIREFFWPLMVGARLIIAKPGGHRDNLYLLDTIKKYSITTVHFVPSMLNIFLEFADTTSCASLRRVICSGEALPKALQERYFPQIDAPLYNLYGPTETAVEVTHWTCDPASKLSVIPIGHPVANTTMYILNKAGQRTPIGVAGALFIGGIQVARGYLARPDLTRERFISDPFSSTPDATLYKTGDLARFLPDGSIEYLGREDFQIKFNGLRIELGEIEEAILSSALVKQVAVICDESTGNQRLLAYMVLEQKLSEIEKDIRELLQSKLPSYMVPQHFIELSAFPLSSSGKLDRKALPLPSSARLPASQGSEQPLYHSGSYISGLWSDLLQINDINPDDRFFEIGGSSLLAISMMTRLSKELDERLPVVMLFDTPTVRGLTSALWQHYFEKMSTRFPSEAVQRKRSETIEPITSCQSGFLEEDIAVIGMAGRFPGAEDIESFWSNLLENVESVQFASDDDLRLAAVSEDDIADKEYIRSFFSADVLDGFDAVFFGYQPREVDSMDPQHRLFLELAWTALDNAGYSNRLKGDANIGIFGGIARDAYLHHFVSQHPQYKDLLGEFHVNIGNDKNFPSTRVAYKLNLKGPAVNVQTACSTSGVALHLACQNIRLGECDLAVVGGCRVLVPFRTGYRYVEGSALSSDGHLFTFDQRASGMVRGSGGAFIVIKSLSKAIQDKDCIRGIIKSTAINNDGSEKIGFTAPSVKGQAEVITNALKKAKINPESIGYIEAHGTGTALGDPIEVMAINRAYHNFTHKKHFCYLGSVKTNIGHLDAGAAVTGIIKSLLAMETGNIPASLNYQTPSPEIDFANSPFMVNNQCVDWHNTKNTPRRCGVSSFGLGGTNFHTILEQAPDNLKNCGTASHRPCQLITLSAKSETSLLQNAAGLVDYSQQHPDISPGDLAFSLNTLRPEYTYRTVLFCHDTKVIGESELSTAKNHFCDEDAAPVAFLFPAGGEETLIKLLFLAQHELQSHKHIDSCCQAIDNKLSFPTSEQRLRYLESLTNQNTLLFILEYTVARLWMKWGIIPKALYGTGTGQIVASCISESLSISEGIALLQDRITATEAIQLLINIDNQWIKSDVSSEKQTDSHKQQATLPSAVISALSRQTINLFLEIGPKQFSQEKGLSYEIIHSYSSENGSAAQENDLIFTLGKLWLKGQPIAWTAYYDLEPHHQIPLPPFQFNRHRFWLDLPGAGPHSVMFAAESQQELQSLESATLNYLQTHQEENLIKLSIPSSQSTRLLHRSGFVLQNQPDAIQLLLERDQQHFFINGGNSTPKKIAFMFPGGGAQYLRMGRGLYERHGCFRRAIDKGLALFASRTGYNLKKVWFSTSPMDKWAEQEMKRTSVQLPAIFILEIALARLWQHWGIEPDALIGHSLGENTAACLAGVLSYEDALGLVTLRGKLFEKTETGAMVSIPLPPEELSPYLGTELDLATINSPVQCVVSGRRAQIEQLYQNLEKDDIEAHILPINTAAHSRLLEPVLQEFGDYLRSIKLHPPSIPFISNTSGHWIKDDEATDPEYWVNHLRHTIRFADGLQTLSRQEDYILLEAGPGKTLCSLVKSQNPELGKRSIPTLRHPKEDIHDQIFLLKSITRLLVAGVGFNWQALNQDLPQVILKITTQSLAQAGIPVSPETPLQTHTTAARQPDKSPQLPITTLSSHPGSTVTMSRTEFIANKISSIISGMSGVEEEILSKDQSFLSMGFDSLFLTQANLRFKKAFKVKTTLKQLLRDAPTINALSDFIDQKLPADALQDELQPASPQPAPPDQADNPTQEQHQGNNMAIQQTMPTVTGNAPLEQAIALQIQASNALLACIQGGITQQQTAAPLIPPPSSQQQEILPASTTQVTPLSASSPGSTSHGPYAPLQKSISAVLSAKQEKYLTDFICKYTEKTKKSKLLAEKNRPFYADPRTVMGFKTLFKEMTYTLAGKRSKGSRVWDIDGNEYVDCMGGFGAIFFGHAPDFVTKAVQKQLETTLDYGPQTPAGGRIARLICEFTGMERVSFCNTGSESTLAAMRIARTVTGNEIIVMFQGAYHGIFDEVLVRAQDIKGNRRNVPVAPGIPESASKNILILDYGAPESLEIIKEKSDDIAGVIIEPIQSRNPELQPKQFVQDLRKLTRDLEIPMIFDEIITGFRLHPKGAQGWYSVDVDIACYGKVIGGGFPVGVIAGKKEYLDALDGGQWNFGDDSFPEVGVTYFAGTFVRHPVALAALEAVLLKLKELGPNLQLKMNKKVSIFTEKVNRRYRQLGAPIELVSFSSAFLIRYHGNKDYEPLYWHHLRHFGAHHIWGNRPSFLTVAHNQEDMDFLFNSFEQAAMAMQQGGFLPKAADLPIETHPWTSLQSELWLAITQGDTTAAAYNEQVMFEVEQDIDPVVFELAMDRVNNRHPSLRARVSDDEHGLLLKHYMAPEFVFHDLCDSHPDEQQQHILELVQTNIDTPFDFKKGPLSRTLLIKVGKNKNIICLCASHLVCDGWSLEIIMEDIAGYYTSIAQSRYLQPRPVPPLSDMTDALKSQEESEEIKDSREFWLSIYKNNLPPDLDLPLDRPRPRVRTFAGERKHYYLDSNLNDPLRQFAKENGCTYFILMLTAYVILLNRLTRQNDIVVGIPAAGQPVLGLPDLVAHNVAFLPLRSKIEPTQNFKEFLETVSNAFMDAKDNQGFAFGEILKELKIPRDPSRLPLVTTSFNMDMAFNPLEFDSVLAKFIPAPRGLSKYDLLFTLTDEGDRVLIEVDRNTDIFQSETIDRWVGNYECLLREILKDPEKNIGEIPMLESDQKQMIIEQWNNTKREYSLDSVTLHGLFESAVDKHPDQVALIYEQQKLTYREFDERINQLAHQLRDIGISSEHIVAIMLDRSFEMMIAIFAILKAGGAYLPLDPTHPIERIRYILEESRTKLVLTQEKFDKNLPDQIQRIHLDTQWKATAKYPSSRPENKTSPDNLAYVIYTSGSTGHPKGVMNEHRAICNHTLWMKDEFSLTTEDVVLQKTPYTFDVSLWELFLPLISGAQLVIARPDGHKTTDYLIKVIKDTGVTHVHFVASMLHLFLDDNKVKSCTSLKRVLCSGEAITKKLQNKFFTLLSNVELYNLYGPTEAAVHVTSMRLMQDDPSPTVPIGRPIANTRIYILDDTMQPQPIGVPGNLYIGGVQVARGYLNRPDLTGTNFSEDPFCTDDGGRLYTTGDLARFRPDGVIEYIGRNDFQVKIRGLRIELGEIESVLEQSPSVRQCVITAREDREQDQRLVAYILPSTNGLFDVAQLRAQILAHLPDYMMPQHFIEMASFPLTSSGKIDRKALPAPDDVAVSDSQSYEPPSTEIEKVIQTCWEQALGLQQIGIHDDFFEIGGHSLLAIQALAKINEQLSIVISLNMIFSAPTIHRLATLIEEELSTDETRKLKLSIPERAKDATVPATSQQQRLWYLAQLNATYLSAHNNADSFRIRGPLDFEALQKTIQTIVQRHEILRTNISFEEEALLQIIRPNIHLDLTPITLQEFGAASVEDLPGIHQTLASQPIDIAKDPLFTAQLVRIDKNDHALVLTINHLVFDGWSYDLLFDELYTCYNAYAAGKTPSLRNLPVQYADYAVWQQGFLQSPYVQHQLDFWKNNLSGKLPILDLPLDKPRPPVQSFDCREARFAYDQELVEALESTGKKHGCTLYMMLIAIYTLTLHRFSRQREVIIGTPISGRNIDDISHLIGFFVNTLTMRFSINPEIGFMDWMQEVKKVCLDAYNNQDTPFELIVQELQPPRDLSRPPIFQTLLIYQDVRNRSMDFDDLEMESFHIERTALQTELDIWMKRERSGLWGGFLYPTALFNSDTAKRLAYTFVDLARQVCDQPDTPLNQLAQANRQEIETLADWNKTDMELSALTFPDILKKSVNAFPDNIAVSCNGNTISYADLDIKSNQLAQYLLNKGLEKNALVGVCMNRSENLLVVLLAIWKAGFAYVPLDPEYPESRLQYMVETASVPLLVTESSLTDRLKEFSGLRICIDSETELIASQKSSPLPHPVSAEDLAYVIFTSGSTGKPKGVKIPHKAVANFLLSMTEKPGISQADILLAVTTLSFDISVLELFLPLTAGATTVILDRHSASDGEALKKCLLETKATIMQATPSTWRILLESGWQPASQFKILCGGEAFPQDLVDKLTANSDHVWNMYGPTETTIWSACHKLNPTDSTLYIGKPIANTQTYILDKQGNPLPIGVTGELHIGGLGVSQGYINRPDLTDRQFIQNPWSTTPGDLLYKTGDLARYHQDGLLECLGRIDTQVKVRGHRIELGEIDTILSQHPDISHAVVNVFEIKPGDQRLVAYIITSRQEEITINEVRKHLRKELPEYMVPQHVMQLDAFPLTPAGKIDRKSLPAPLKAQINSSQEYVAPKTETEQKLTEMWQESLGIEHIGIHDNFFDVGGHSLLAVTLFAKIRKAFSIELPLAVLFQTPTVHELAERIDTELYLAAAKETITTAEEGDEREEFEF